MFIDTTTTENVQKKYTPYQFLIMDTGAIPYDNSIKHYCYMLSSYYDHRTTIH